MDGSTEDTGPTALWHELPNLTPTDPPPFQMRDRGPVSHVAKVIRNGGSTWKLSDESTHTHMRAGGSLTRSCKEQGHPETSNAHM